MIQRVKFGKVLRNFSTIQKFALLAPLNTLILPELSFFTKFEKEQQDFLHWLAADELLTTWASPSMYRPHDSSKTTFELFLEGADQNFKDTYQEALKSFQEFQAKNALQSPADAGEESSARKHLKPMKEMTPFEIENITFDKNFYAAFDDLVALNPQKRRARLSPEEFSVLIAGQTVGTLSRLEFCQFRHDYLRINAAKLRGKNVVKILRPVSKDEFDLGDWLRTNIAARVRKYSNTSVERQMALRRPNVNGVSPTEISLDSLRGRLEEGHKDFLFGDVGRIWERMEENQFQVVEYQYTENTLRTLTELTQPEFEHFLALLSKDNEILKNLMLKASFINASQFKEISAGLSRGEAAQYFNYLLGLLVSKMVFSAEEVMVFASEAPLLLKAEFLKLTFKNFSDSYLASWLSLDLKNRETGEEDYSGGNSQRHIAEIYEHIKSIYDQGASPAKKILVDKLTAFIKSVPLRESVLRIISEELERFSEINEQDSDFQNIKNYLELILKLPFGKLSPDSTHLQKARKILDDSHFGMEEVKERIMQFLSVGKLKGSFISNKILCLLGPPGVGKTSIAKAVAECLGRRFVRISLGGENDVSVIKGHRRTYLGSYPGKIVNALKMAGTENPVILLDEVDKLGRSSYKGNVQDVLLEILDPAQNHTFYDHYLDLPIDLSKVLFLCSANILDSSTISAPLYDRLEVIEVSGYTKVEKEKIFHNHLLPKLMTKVGLKKYGVVVNFTKEVVDKLIDDYAREPGVRNLEKKAQTILEKVAFDFLEKTPDLNAYYLKHKKFQEIQKKEQSAATDQPADNGQPPSPPTQEDRDSVRDLPVVYGLDPAAVKKYLGARLYYSQTIFHEKDDLIGFAFGLGYSAYGGSVLSIEVLELPSSENPQAANSKDAKPAQPAADDYHFPHIGNIVIRDRTPKPLEEVPGAKDEPSSHVIISEEQTERISDKAFVKEIAIPNNSHEGSLTVTGSLGDVMKESVEIGYSFAKHYVYRFDRTNQYLEARNLHIHFPEGASKKDGPSAGITIVTALISAALQKPYDPSFAMTGEVSLNGRVLKIGGVREKVLAAKREGIMKVILPVANKSDVEELKDYVREGMTFSFVQHYDDVYQLIFHK